MDGVAYEQCPNCRYPLVTLRQEVQQAGQREVVLHWLICPDCRHVALYRWGFVTTIDDDGTLMREERRADGEDVDRSGVENGRLGTG